MDLVELVTRVGEDVREGSDEQRKWFAEWGTAFQAAVEAKDDDACEDLADSLLVFDRTELRPPTHFTPLEEVIVEFGFDPADFEEAR